jgi:nucleoside-diphosphate-sugar epimerase
MKKVLIIGGTGYIGSALYDFLKATNSIESFDIEWFGNHVNPGNHVIDYKFLTVEQLEKCDVVVLLASHCSVAMANNSTVLSTFNNNVRNFVSLVSKIGPRTKFIYAGSASVYNGISSIPTEEATLRHPANIYDLTKQDIDRYMIRFADVEYYGLRFGSVNGISQNTRSEIIMNAMVLSGYQNKEIRVFSGETRRAILGITDLCRAIDAIINCADDHRGIYNLASFNATVWEIGKAVGREMDVPCIEIKQEVFEQAQKTKLPTPYDFAIDSSKFKTTFNFEFEDTMESIIRNIQKEILIVNTDNRNIGIKYE